MNGHEADDRLGMLALGDLPEGEARALERHVATCGVCRAELAELRDALAVLPLDTPPEAPRARVKEALFARLDAPPAVVKRRVATWSPLWSGLAAALVLALLGDAYLLARPTGPARIAQAPSPAPLPQRTAPTAISTPRATSAPTTTPATPAASPAPRTPSNLRTATPAAADLADLAALDAARADAAALRASLVRARTQAERARHDAAAARARSTILAAALARARADRVAVTMPTPSLAPSAAASATPAANDAASLAVLDALQTGRVYGVDGVVANEPWHCTIVQPTGGNAFVLTRAPSAASGFEYRTWVLRGRTVFDAGALPPGKPETLAMPMPLARGDVVAFSLEPAGSSRPSTPYLMRVTITE